MKIQGISPNVLEEKISDAFPQKFSKKLRSRGGEYYPADFSHCPHTNEQIRYQISMKTFGFRYSFDTVRAFLENVRGRRVIDMGCGFGVDALIMGELGDVEVVAMDIDTEKVSLLESVLDKYKFEDGGKGRDKIIPIEGDILNPPSFDRVFDGVLIKHILGYLACSLFKPVKETMRNVAEHVMNNVKKLAPKGYMTLRDRDLDIYTI
jgi:SAM-dependent methyltransferase